MRVLLTCFSHSLAPCTNAQLLCALHSCVRILSLSSNCACKGPSAHCIPAFAFYAAIIHVKDPPPDKTTGHGSRAVKSEARKNAETTASGPVHRLNPRPAHVFDKPFKRGALWRPLRRQRAFSCGGGGRVLKCREGQKIVGFIWRGS